MSVSAVVDRARLAAGSPAADALLAAGLAVLGEIELWTGVTYEGAAVFPGDPALNAVLIVALCAPLAWRRRRPLAAFSASLSVLAVMTVALGAAQGATVFLVLLLAVYSAAAHGDRPALVLTAGALVMVLHSVLDPRFHGVGDVLWSGGIVAVGWLLGCAVRARTRVIASLGEATARLAEERDERGRLAAAEERTRIARDLHDVVAHAVSLMVIQAQAGQRVLTGDQPDTRDALKTIESAGRGALIEMRRLLGLLRSADELPDRSPVPRLDQIDALLTELQDAGLSITHTTHGDIAAVPAGIELSAYRIVQEALTNTLRHAGPTRARVVLRYHPDHLAIDVTDDGPTTPVTTPQARPGHLPVDPTPSAPEHHDGPDARGHSPAGHGLIGMRERALMHGGRFHAGATDTGGYRVQAHLPLAAGAR